MVKNGVLGGTSQSVFVWESSPSRPLLVTCVAEFVFRELGWLVASRRGRLSVGLRSRIISAKGCARRLAP
ncbi:hypothetical protein A0H81_00726 [Grifola frondosa]|uniref:Uncharacterized protein n=1 Tax=Grifola frondosa TaxID=5627 RepID=A0A1C7MSN7_GRIFR|nr:hypothetical protein A0H81_00726 [Grifola frondosa]